MRLFIVAIFAFASLSLWAAETTTVIASVVDSLKSRRLLVLSAADGRVYKTNSHREMREHLGSLIGKTVRIVYNEVAGEAIITSVTQVAATGNDDLNFFAPSETRVFEPTDVGSPERVIELFDRLNQGDRSRTQCFKRAHIWSYDLWSRFQVTSQKIYIFWSRRYIQLEEYDWWFHVAPVVTANGVDYAMDRTFLNKPVPVTDWKNRFMRSTVTCPTIEHYNQYESQPWNRLCFMMKTPMWYFRPADIRRRDYEGKEKNNWVLMELQDARRAFENGEEVYEALDTGRRTVNH